MQITATYESIQVRKSIQKTKNKLKTKRILNRQSYRREIL